MKISEIDGNFKIETELSQTDISWFSAKNSIFDEYGTVKTGSGYLRMPKAVAESVSDGVASLYANTAGVRIRFCTDSPYIAIKAVYPALSRFPHMPLSGTAGFDLYTESGGRQVLAGAYIPSYESENGFESIVYTGNETGKAINYILNFPPYNPVDGLFIGLKNGSTVEKADRYANKKPVLFYGSSITQGGCASRPGNIYQNFLSRALDMDYTCLGFSGSAKGEKEIAEYMAELDMAAFVCDYDHNAPDAGFLRNTHFALYSIIRKKNPGLPYIMITHPSVGVNEAAERRKTVMESYIAALNLGDENVYFIDGDSLFAGYEYDTCTVDTCHPNDLGFYRMALGMLPTLKKILYFSK